MHAEMFRVEHLRYDPGGTHSLADKFPQNIFALEQICYDTVTLQKYI